MATNVIMPALGMSQDTGKVIKWLKAEGQTVTQGEPLIEIETDKAVVEVEAPATGTLANVTAVEGDQVPVAQVIAVILATGESVPMPKLVLAPVTAQAAPISITPVAARMAEEHKLDLSQIKPQGGRVEKADVLAYLEAQRAAPSSDKTRRIPASPKARRLAAERGLDLATIKGTGPDGAVQAADVPAVEVKPAMATALRAQGLAVSNVWRIMTERITQSWTTVPHFYLLREVNASRLMAWREKAQKQSTDKITYTDLLVKIVAVALLKHPRANATWNEGAILLNEQVHVGLAVAVEEGLVVPVIHRADELAVGEIAARRKDLVARAQAGKLRPEDITGGTFTISNLGMYGVDSFNALINPPQAALLAVGRIAERVVPVNGQPGVQPMMALSLSCDHRVVDGARGAQFLETVADLIQEPLGLLQ